MAASAWQSKLSSFKERNLYAYNKSLFCDVYLSVMDANGDKVTIPAHKYVLAISSPVFEAMFYGQLAETGPSIDVPDCTKKGLQEMLRYVYADEVSLSGSNVLEVLYLAEKFILPFLKEKCEKYLEKQLKPEDVFHVLPQIRNEKVEEKCWEMVDSDTKRAVSAEPFLNTSKEMLRKVLGRDTLSIDEVVLFQAVEKWALNKLKVKGLEESTENKRAVLGEDVIKLIRFPLMSEKKFAEKVLPSGILTMDEVTELIQFFNGLCPLKLGSFSNRKREKSKLFSPSVRFNSIVDPSSFVTWSYSATRGWSDAIDFKVNKPLSLAGVRLFGAEGSTYEVSVALHKYNKTIIRNSSTVSTEDTKKDGYFGYTIYLDDPAPLDPGVVYTIEATISGPDSYFGEQGKTSVAFENVVITHMDSKKSSKYSTSSTVGQFPTLVFMRH